MDQCGQELDNFKEIVKNAKDAEVKVALQPCIYAQDINQYCFQSYKPKPKKDKN